MSTNAGKQLPEQGKEFAAGTQTVIIKPTRGLAALQLRALWQYREIGCFFARYVVM